MRPTTLDLPLLTENQIASLLNVRVKTIQSWRVKGGGPKFLKLGRCVRYRPNDVQEFIEARIRKSTSEYDK